MAIINTVKYRKLGSPVYAASKAISPAAPLVPGIVIGVVGMAGIVAAYPLYRLVLKRQRARIAPQILQLTAELSQ